MLSLACLFPNEKFTVETPETETFTETVHDLILSENTFNTKQ